MGMKSVWAVPILFGITLMMINVMPLANGERPDVTCVTSPRAGPVVNANLCSNRLSIGDHVQFVILGGAGSVQRICHLEVIDVISTTQVRIEIIHSIIDCEPFIGQQFSLLYISFNKS